MQFFVSLKFGISLVVPLAVSLRHISIIFFQQRHKQVTRKLLCASHRPGIVIKFRRQIVRDADPGHDVTKSRCRKRSHQFISSLLLIGPHLQIQPSFSGIKSFSVPWLKSLMHSVLSGQASTIGWYHLPVFYLALWYK